MQAIVGRDALQQRILVVDILAAAADRRRPVCLQNGLNIEAYHDSVSAAGRHRDAESPASRRKRSSATYTIPISKLQMCGLIPSSRRSAPFSLTDLSDVKVQYQLRHTATIAIL